MTNFVILLKLQLFMEDIEIFMVMPEVSNIIQVSKKGMSIKMSWPKIAAIVGIANGTYHNY